MLLAPIFFSACEETEEITGNIELTINGQVHSFPIATFVKTGDYTTITSTNISNTVSVIFKGKTKGNYTLGIGKDLIDALLNINQITNVTDKNVVVYYPTGESENAFIALMGNLTISEYSADKIVGAFSGKGITKDKITAGIDSTFIVSNYEDFAGTFVAKSVSINK